MRTKKGIVTSTKQDKTAVITVHTYKNHPLYKKRYRISTKFYAHDEENKANLGDIVMIEETNPISKTKRWKIIENLGNNEGAILKPEVLADEAILAKETKEKEEKETQSTK